MEPVQTVAVILLPKYRKTLKTLGVLRDSVLNCIFLVSLMKVGITLI